MKWKTKVKERKTEWHQVFVVLPKHTNDGYTVVLGKVWRRWKIHADGGKYVYNWATPPGVK